MRRGENYDLIDPRGGKKVGELNASEVYDKIVKMAWTNGEPGIIFLDRLNRDNVVPCVGEIESTNPCGEQPLLPDESCNLGSINLSAFVEDGEMDYEGLEEVVKKAVHFLDNVIEMNQYPLKEIEEMTKQHQKNRFRRHGFCGHAVQARGPTRTVKKG